MLGGTILLYITAAASPRPPTTACRPARIQTCKSPDRERRLEPARVTSLKRRILKNVPIMASTAPTAPREGNRLSFSFKALNDRRS